MITDVTTNSRAPTSWLPVSPFSDFSLDNLPYGVCSFPPNDPRKRCVTILGGSIIDLAKLSEAGLFDDIWQDAAPTPLSARMFASTNLNAFMATPKSVWSAVRKRLISLLITIDGEDNNEGIVMDNRLRSNAALQKAAIRPANEAQMHLPAEIGDYTDFYSSKEHATNVGIMFRSKENALQPNWTSLPVGYHGRSSTVCVSGTPVVRPCGQLQKDPTDPKQGSIYGPSKLIDFELEMAFFVGGLANGQGRQITMDEVSDRIFGFVLMNDWSARDIQKWEYVPLGPFGSKNFATTISPWVVSAEALIPFQCSTSAGAEQTDPVPLPYLQDPKYDKSAYNVRLEVAIQGEDMNQPHTVCVSNMANLYWNARQQLVHHSVTGCVMKAGDLLGSGTISGPDQRAFGSMLELSWKGTREVPLGDSNQARKFLQDGDNVLMRAYAEKDGLGRVGFGSCDGKILPAVSNGNISATSTGSTSPSNSNRYKDIALYGHRLASSTRAVQVALNAKGLSYSMKGIHRESLSKFGKLGLTMERPLVLECIDTSTGQKLSISQPLAIIDFIEEAFVNVGSSLFPADFQDKIVAKEIAEIADSTMLSQQDESMLSDEVEDNEMEFADKRNELSYGLGAIDDILRKRRTNLGDVCGPYALGTFSPTLADAFIVPLMSNSRRLGLNCCFNLSKTGCDFPTLATIAETANQHKWFQMKYTMDEEQDDEGEQGGQSPSTKRVRHDNGAS